MHKIKAIISGSDGTLLNSLYLIRRGQYEAVVAYLVDRGIARHEIPPYEEYEQLLNQSVGGSTRDTFEKTLRRLFGKKHQEQLAVIDFDDLDRRLGPIQDRLAPLCVHPFFDLNGFLQQMGVHGLGLGLFTSGSRYHILRNWGNALPALGYMDLFQKVGVSEDEKLTALIQRAKATYGLAQFHIVTCDDVAATKPDPEGVKKLLDELGIQPQEAVLLGDLDADIVAGVKAGVIPIGVSYGFGQVSDLKAAGAVKVVDRLSEVMQLVLNHNAGKKVF